MTESLPTSSLQLRSLVTEQGTLELSLTEVPIPTLKPDDVLVRVEAAPINPSDLGLLLAGADVTSAVVEGTPERPVVRAPLVEGALRALAARVGKSLSVGNEGAGTVVAAGASPDSQSLLGRTVALAGGSMYSQHRAVSASSCLVLPAGHIGQGRGILVCQPAHRLGHDRNHATRGTQRSRSHSRRIQPWPDVGEALSRGRCATRRHRS